MAPHLVGHLVGQLGPAVVHGEQDRRDPQRRVQVRLHQLDVAEQLAEPLQRVVLALDRDQHLVRGHHRVHREQAQRRRAVHEHVVRRELLHRVRLQRLLQAPLARDHRDELDLRAGQVDRRGHAVQVGGLGALRRGVGDADLTEEHLVHRGDAGAVVHAQRGARVPLRVEVDHEHLQPLQRQRGREVHRARRLADPALLVRDRQHAAAVGAGELHGLGVQHPGRPLRFLHDRSPTHAIRGERRVARLLAAFRAGREPHRAHAASPGFT